MKLLFAADVAFARLDGEKGVSDEIGDPADAFEEVKPYFEQADLSMLNQENIFRVREGYTPIIKSGPNLISSPDYVTYLDYLHPTVIGFANNHAGDFGEEALKDSLELLSQKGYPCIGAGRNPEEAHRPFRFEKDGVKISILAVCENEFGTAKKDHAGSAGYELGWVIREIQAEKDAGYHTIVYFHGGNETNPVPSPEKTGLYRSFIDMGASAVVAMHTHCPQGYEMYKGKPIIYSMGNFYFYSANPSLETWNYGYMTSLQVEAGAPWTLQIIPYHLVGKHLHVLEGEEKADFQAYMDRLCSYLPDEEKINQLFDGWCLIGGTGYAKSLVLTEEMKTDPAKIARLRNLYTCEAHNELMKCYLLLYFSGDLQKAEEAAKELRELQQWPGVEVS